MVTDPEKVKPPGTVQGYAGQPSGRSALDSLGNLTGANLIMVCMEIGRDREDTGHGDLAYWQGITLRMLFLVQIICPSGVLPSAFHSSVT
jgi:hypothetical protein